MMVYFYAAIALLVGMACDYFPEGRGHHPGAAIRIETDTLWGWHCDTAFYLAKARPGEYLDRKPPQPPALGEIIEKDTVILFISTNCPFSGAANLEKSYKSP